MGRGGEAPGAQSRVFGRHFSYCRGSSVKEGGEGLNEREMDQEKCKDKTGSIRHKDEASFCYPC